MDKTNLRMKSWTTFTNLTGTGGTISITTEIENTKTFYQVSPLPRKAWHWAIGVASPVLQLAKRVAQFYKPVLL